MAENTLPKKNAAYTFYMVLVDTGSRPNFRANPTLAAGDVQVSTDGAGFGNLGTLPVVTPASGVAVKVDLSAAEMNGDNVTVKFIDAAGAEWDNLFVEIRPATRKAEDLAFPTTTGRSLDITATGAAGIDWGNVENKTTPNNLSATDIQLCGTITTYTGDTPQTADHTAAIADVPTVSEFNARTVVSASYFDPAVDTVATVTTVTNQLTAVTVGNQVWDTDATARQTVGTFGKAIGDPAVNTETIYDAVVTDATGINVAADVAAVLVDTADMQPKLGTPVADLSADIAAIKAQTDDIGEDGAGLTALPWNAVWDAEVESEVNDALDAAISELGVAAPTATPTIRTALMLMYMALRNKTVVQTSGTDALEIYNNAGTKIAAKLLTDDGTDYTEAEMT